MIRPLTDAARLALPLDPGRVLFWRGDIF